MRPILSLRLRASSAECLRSSKRFNRSSSPGERRLLGREPCSSDVVRVGSMRGLGSQVWADVVGDGCGVVVDRMSTLEAISGQYKLETLDKQTGV